MPSRKHPLIVAGIDVGGPRKGFHAVALRDGAYHAAFHSVDAAEVVEWCRTRRARLIGVDAPCRWSTDGHARPAECELMAKKIWCFSTPTRKAALDHPTNHYSWMLNGAALFRLLEETHPLCRQIPAVARHKLCFETFPHAITSALAKRPVSARDKRTLRRSLLQKAFIETTRLTNIDFLDAALCALTAFHLASSAITHYGDADTGLILVPAPP